MKHFYTLILFACTISIYSQANFNMTLVAQKDWGEGGSGCWGHTDTKGIEYAIIGTTKSIKILSLEDPTKPNERLSIPGATTTWREARAYGNFIYVTTESQDGVTIIDLTKGPDSMSWKRWKPVVPNFTAAITTVHSINMDELGFLYLNGNNPVRGVAIFDTKKDGNNPEFMSSLTAPYTHDCYATKTILYTADLSQGIGVYDIKDKKNPVLLNRFTSSRNFTHNMWTSPDEKFLYTTDEVSGATIDIYDVADPTNVKFLGKYQNQDTRTDKTIPHNIYAVGPNYAVTSWYTDGVLITDMTRPDNIVKVASFDTYLPAGPETGTWFLGCWGVYPYLKSGNIIASDMSTGFWLIKPTYQRASYLEGKVLLREPNGTLTPLPNATITIKSAKKSFGKTNGNGIYKTGIGEPGQYTILFSHPSIFADSAIVTLKSGEVVIKDYIIDVQYTTGKIVTETNKAIPNPKIIYSLALPNNQMLSNSSLDNIQLGSANGDTSGSYRILTQPNNKYSLIATAWGYEPKEIQITNLTTASTIQLKAGFKDDFLTDLGWQNTIKSTSGNWERGVPAGTLNGTAQSNPAKDADNDLGNQAYVTGINGGAPGDFDVDGGTTILESPAMSFEGFDSVSFTYQKWFYNGGGSTTPNDKFTIYLSNGTSRIAIDSTNTNTPAWLLTTKALSRRNIPFTNNMRLILETGDDSVGHLVEAGFDNFKAQLLKFSTPTFDQSFADFKVSPNPFNNQLNVIGDNVYEVKIFDLTGRQVYSTKEKIIPTHSFGPGAYLIQAISQDGKTSAAQKIIKTN
jgi:choice-of-anchor B domain-containing protein